MKTEMTGIKSLGKKKNLCTRKALKSFLKLCADCLIKLYDNMASMALPPGRKA